MTIDTDNHRQHEPRDAHDTTARAPALRDLVRRRAAQLAAVGDERKAPAQDSHRKDLQLRTPAAPHHRRPKIPRLGFLGSSRSAHSSTQRPNDAQNSWQWRQLEVLQRIDENLRRIRQMAESSRQAPVTFTPPEV